MREPLLNVNQVAALFQRSTETIYRWQRFGYLPTPVKKFGSPMWDYNDIIRHMREMPDTDDTYRFPPSHRVNVG